MKHTIKIDFYDKFRCIADQCTFSCCKGWEITVDSDTCKRWKNCSDNSVYFLGKMKSIKKVGCRIRMGKDKECPFLTENGLCDIVIRYGEAYLSDTCRCFPRLVNDMGYYSEYALSCACPAVIDILKHIPGSLEFLDDGDEATRGTNSQKNSIRDVMIAVMQREDFSISDRLALIFHLLLSVKEEEKSIKALLESYQDEKHVIMIQQFLSEAVISDKDSLLEKNELFLDLVQNYRKEKSYQPYLQELYSVAEGLDTGDVINRWTEFTKVFEQYDKLMEHCIVSKIFAGCTGEDMDDIIRAFQILVTEYVMVRYAAFIKWLSGGISYPEIRDYIVICSRMIGYNAEGMKEFWEESFDEAIWELGYLLLLVN
ncbi:MAG TPA: flagellin lysine-N-methylase [Mobilitalea sp.]|nr:flagellin lysine-N-methylase [Mobilitalea sp.]